MATGAGAGGGLCQETGGSFCGCGRCQTPACLCLPACPRLSPPALLPQHISAGVDFGPDGGEDQEGDVIEIHSDA